ncbi:MAG: LptF/LptG family permease [Gemmatimonadaceae bacterium]|nr:LptF/LptG family permease [Gemmatimonadaceae bacterium]
MKLLTRYVIREHVGPLIFSLSAMTSLLMLQYVARQLANLAGKGLPWGAIGRFFVLSLPFTVAMTMPMAVLMATLYAFGRMAAEHEITALKASGVKVRSLMAPVLWCALLLSLFMVWFNDQVLPASNHRLRILQGDIGRTKPTLALKDQVLNPLSEQFFMRVARTDAATNRMWDVTIYDLRKGTERKTIYADSGVFSVASNGQDLQMQLYNGYVQEFTRGDVRRLQRTYFITQTVKVGGIAQGFQTTKTDGYKGDREMSVCEMHARYRGDAAEFHRIRREYVDYAFRLARKGQAVTAPRDRPEADPLAVLYCEQFLSRAEKLLLPAKVGAQPPAKPDTSKPKADTAKAKPDSAKPQPPASAPAPPPIQGMSSIPGMTKADSIAMARANAIAMNPDSVRQDSIRRIDSIRVDSMQKAMPKPQPVDTIAMLTGAIAGSRVQLLASREGLDNLAVEIHKKFALSFACLVFVLFGPPIALRFPRGGVGVTIGVSIGVFGLYYVCLMGGESLADKGMLPAWFAMWIANIVFTVAGVLLLWGLENTTDTSRGGGLKDRFDDWRTSRRLRREAKAGARA